MYNLTVSIVLYKSGEDTLKAINSILNTQLSIRLFLIDNSPTDELKGLVRDSRVTYVFNGANIGFGAGHNLAIRQIINTSSYHLVVNPDIEFASGTIEILYKYMEANKEVGHLMPKVLYPDGSIQYLCKLIPTPFDLIFRRFIPGKLVKARIERNELRHTNYDKIMEVPYLSGCFMFLRTESLQKAGLFDERFFMYPEDIDLTRRIHQHYKTIFYPHATVIHVHEKGSYKNFHLLKIHIINMVKYFNKWGWFFDKERKEINRKILRQVK